MHAFVSSRLDYCNSMLFGINESLLDKLQSVLRAAARLVQQKKKFDSISTDIRDKLHWLPIRQRIEFEICVLVHRCLQGTAPDYLAEMLTLTADVPALPRHRSAALGTADDCGSTLRQGRHFNFFLGGGEFFLSIPPDN